MMMLLAALKRSSTIASDDSTARFLVRTSSRMLLDSLISSSRFCRT